MRRPLPPDELPEETYDDTYDGTPRKVVRDRDSLDAERIVLDTLGRIDAEGLDPCYYLANEHARRVFVDIGHEALCRHGHPVRRTTEDHIVLFQLLDWPREGGGTIAECVAADLEARRSRRAGLARRIAEARLALVRVTSRAGLCIGCEDMSTGQTFRAHVPLACPMRPGEALISRFAEPWLGYAVPVVDLLVVSTEALDAVESLRRDDGIVGPDERSTEAARLFQAWCRVSFGGETGIIDPRDHAEAFSIGV